MTRLSVPPPPSPPHPHPLSPFPQDERCLWRGLSPSMLLLLVFFCLPQALLVLWHLLVPALGLWCAATLGRCPD